MHFIPSPEQQALFDYVFAHINTQGRKALAIDAKAGTGKTSSILELIKLLNTKGHDVKGIYAAFNKDIVKEVSPKLEDTGVTAKTFHSLSMGSLLKHLRSKHKIKIPKNFVDANKYKDLIKSYIEQNPRIVELFEDAASFSDDASPLDIRKAFIHSANQLCHFIRVRLEVWDDLERLNWLITDYQLDDQLLTPELLDIMATMQSTILSQGEEILKQTGVMDFDDMIYWVCKWDIHLWSNKWVFVDESQDLSPMQRMIVSKVVDHKNGFIIIVGDPNQCVIEGTIIGNNPVETIKVGDTVPSGAGNGKIRHNIVTDVFKNHVENQPVITIKTKSGHSLTTTPEHIYFAEFMHDENRKKYFTYLMYKNGYGYRIGVTRSYRSASSHTLGYKVRSNQEGADAMWLLRISNTEAEARYHENLYAAKFGLPTITFKYVGSSPNSAGMSLSQDMIDKLYSTLDTETPAKKMLEYLNINIDYPHHSPKCTIKERRRNATITLCSDPRGNSVLHKLEMSGNDPNDEIRLQEAGIPVTDNGKGTGWRLRKASKDLKVIHNILQQVKQVMEVNVIQNANLSKGRSLAFMPATNILTGMSVFVEIDGEIVKDRVVSVEESNYTGYVYDLNVEHVHNFIANGITTHNSIYRFAGADSDSFQRTVNWFKADVLPLTVTRRCDTIIAHHAAELVPNFTALESKDRGKIIWLDEKDFADNARPGDMVICRLKSPLISKAIEVIAKEIPAVILGGNIGTALIEVMEKISKRDGFRWSDPVKAVESYQFVQSRYYLQKEDEAAADTVRDDCDAIKVLLENSKATSLKIFDDYVNELFSDKDGTGKVIFCTAHKSKGLEASRVFFLKPDKMPLIYPGAHPEAIKQEKNLKYVLMTRAENELVYLVNPDFIKKYETKDRPTFIQYDFETHRWTEDGLYMLDEHDMTAIQLPSGGLQAQARPDVEVVAETLLEDNAVPTDSVLTFDKESGELMEIKIPDKNEEPPTPPAIEGEADIISEEPPITPMADIEKAIAENPLTLEDAAKPLYEPTNASWDDLSGVDNSIPIPEKVDTNTLPTEEIPVLTEPPTEPVAWANWVLANKEQFVVLDTETSTWANAADCEIVQLGITDMNGNVLFNQRIKPHQAIVSEGASNVHGITNDMLVNERHIEAYLPEITAMLEGKYIIAYNAPFDKQALEKTFKHANINNIDTLDWLCAMRMYTKHNGNKTNKRGRNAWWKLTEAVEQQGITASEDAHDAIADVLMTVDLIKSMALDDVNRWQNKYGFKSGDVVEVKASGARFEVIQTMPNGQVNMKASEDDSRQTMDASAIQLIAVLDDPIEQATTLAPKPTLEFLNSGKGPYTPQPILVIPAPKSSDADDTPTEINVEVLPEKPEAITEPAPKKKLIKVTPVPNQPHEHRGLEAILKRFGSREKALEMIELLTDAINEVYPE